jgi:hypothetical protein
MGPELVSRVLRIDGIFRKMKRIDIGFACFNYRITISERYGISVFTNFLIRNYIYIFRYISGINSNERNIRI